MKNHQHFIIDFDSTLVMVESLDALADIALRGAAHREEKLREIQKITVLGMEVCINSAIRSPIGLGPDFFPVRFSMHFCSRGSVLDTRNAKPSSYGAMRNDARMRVPISRFAKSFARCGHRQDLCAAVSQPHLYARDRTSFQLGHDQGDPKIPLLCIGEFGIRGRCFGERRNH